MTEPYTYHTPYGELTVSSTDANDSVCLQIEHADDATVVVLTEHLNDFILNLCRQAGERAPIVLDQPDPKYTEKANTGWGTLTSRDGAVWLETHCQYCDGTSHRSLDSTAAAAVAAVIAAMAEWVRSEPDPDQVAWLAQLMRELNPPQEEWNDSKPLAPTDAWARALLRHCDIRERNHA